MNIMNTPKISSFLMAAACLSLPVLAWMAPMQAAADVQASSNGPLTISGAIQEARLQSPELRRAQAAEREASWGTIDAVSAYVPKISVSANHLFDAKFQVLDVPSPTGTTAFALVAPYSLLSLDASWTVFDGLNGVNMYRAARDQHNASELELQRAGFSLDETVRLRFYQALGAQILADVAQQNVKTLQDHLQKTQDILSRGSATKFDLLRVQVQLEEAVSEKIGADDNVVLARKNLAVAMGIDDDSRALVGELPVPSESLIPQNLKADFTARTDLAALRSRADAASEAHSASYGAWLPHVTFAAEKQFYDNQNDDIWAAYRNAYSVGVLLSWNLFDGGASIARSYETHYRAQQAEAAADAASLRAPQEFELYKRRFRYNTDLYRAKKRAVEMAQESVRLATLGYNAGTRTSTDVLDAELDLIRARAGVVRAQVDGAEALINLELAVGKGLTQQ